MHSLLPDFNKTFCNDAKVASSPNDCSWNEDNKTKHKETANSHQSLYDSHMTFSNEDTTNQSKQIKRRRQNSQQNDYPGILNGSICDKKLGIPAKRAKKSCFVVRAKEMQAFFGLLSDELIQDFLDVDSCVKIADKYLLAMVFAYFKRADFSLREYSRSNFFIALYLANDVEEDDEEIKYEVFPWALGKRWKNKYPEFLRKRDKLLKRIDYRAIVSRRCCEEIMGIQPDHFIWKRNRPEHHSGAIRAYMHDPDDDGYPRGPYATPRTCFECDVTDSQYDSASPASVSWYVSSANTSPAEYTECAGSGFSSFDMKGLQQTLMSGNSDDVWPTTEE